MTGTPRVVKSSSTPPQRAPQETLRPKRRSASRATLTRASRVSPRNRAIRALRARRDHAAQQVGPGTLVAVFGTGVYGGYFGAAQGIMLLAFLGIALDEPLQRLNAVKNVLAGLVNLLAGVIFAIVAHIAWDAAGLIAAGSVAGGILGARYGRRLPAGPLRALIVAVGVVAIVRLL